MADAHKAKQHNLSQRFPRLAETLGKLRATVGVSCFLALLSVMACSAGEPVVAWLMPTQEGALLYVGQTNHGKSPTITMVALDPRTGQVLGHHVFDASWMKPRCWPATGTRAWCVVRSEPYLFETRTLEKIDSLKHLVEAAHLHPLAGRWDNAGDHAFVPLDDGRFARIDADTLRVQALDSKAEPAQAKASARMRGERVVSTRCQTLAFARSQGMPLAIGEGTRRHLITKAGASQETYLEPKFLFLGTNDAAYLLHVTSLDRHRARHLLTRIDGGGRQKWTVDLGGACQLATLTEDGKTLVIAADSLKPRARAIDVETGKDRWRYEP